MRLCEKEELFFKFSAYMDKEDAIQMTEDIAYKIESKNPKDRVIREYYTPKEHKYDWVRYVVEAVALIGSYFLI